MVPLTGQRLYVFLVKAAPRGLPRQTSLAAIRADFEGFANPVPEVLAALAGSELLHHDLEELARPVWGHRGTVLIGDAAHAMTPNLGQGASMAIEDAVLLPDIVHIPDPTSALARRREARVAQIQRRSRWLGELAHWQSPVAVSLRNFVLRGLPQWVGERQYAHMIEAGPAVGPNNWYRVAIGPVAVEKTRPRCCHTISQSDNYILCLCCRVLSGFSNQLV
jgi:hypothetical protein